MTEVGAPPVPASEPASDVDELELDDIGDIEFALDELESKIAPLALA